MFWVALQAEGESSRRVDCTTSLSWWALQFTPKVARVDDTLLLELSASERLWRGRAQLLSHIHESAKPVAAVKYAQGATSLVAMARLQAASLAGAKPDDLPLVTLVAARPHLAILERMGCNRWGQLRALPRDGVARRFGAPVLDALDRAYGLKPELYPWLLLPEVFEATLELAAQVETAQALLFGARRLFNQLQLWLQLRHSGVLALEFIWTMDARRNTAAQGKLILRSAEPTTDMPHLQRLLGEHLARIALPAPVLYLCLRTLETQKLKGQSASLLPDDRVIGDSLYQLLERLEARLGAQQVLHLQDHADHRPERMQIWQQASGVSQPKAVREIALRSRDLNHFKEKSLYPTWLLATPLKLAVLDRHPQYAGALTLLIGPQRLEAGWWGGGDCALRDYFVARSEQFGLLWIYRERLAGSGAAGQAVAEWYLHGLFA